MKKHLTLPLITMLFSLAPASALPFRVVGYEAGGGLPGIAGDGIRVDQGGFFVADRSGTPVLVGPAPGFATVNNFEFDSHFSLDPYFPSARNRSGTPSDNSVTTLSFYGDYGCAPPDSGVVCAVPANYNEGEWLPGCAAIVNPASHIGDFWSAGIHPDNLARGSFMINVPPVHAFLAPKPTGGRSACDGVFVGRFTIKHGAQLTGGMLLRVESSPDVIDSHELSINGSGVLFSTHNGPQQLTLNAYLVNFQGPINIQNPSAATDEGELLGEPFGLADVYDLWVQSPPPCFGDANKDGFVNFADVTSTLTNWSHRYVRETGPGDANGDRVVNHLDITQTLMHFEMSCD